MERGCFRFRFILSDTETKEGRLSHKLDWKTFVSQVAQKHVLFTSITACNLKVPFPIASSFNPSNQPTNHLCGHSLPHHPPPLETFNFQFYIYISSHTTIFYIPPSPSALSIPFYLISSYSTLFIPSHFIPFPKPLSEF